VRATLPTKMTILLKGRDLCTPGAWRTRCPVRRTVRFDYRPASVLPYEGLRRVGIYLDPTWWLEFDRSLFPEMLQAIPALTQRFVGILLDRVREITRMEQQSEKLNALGKLAGNLAHELNNPASAAQRSAAGVWKNCAFMDTSASIWVVCVWIPRKPRRS